MSNSNIRAEFQRMQAYFDKVKEPCVAVFDLGTRASRLLVGPKHVPSTIDSATFFNVGSVNNLGSSVNRLGGDTDIQCEGIQGVVRFIREYVTILQHFGVEKSDITAVGTAVFRWIKNQSEVCRAVEQATGISLTIISKSDEALFSLVGVAFSLGLNHGLNADTFDDDDVILLIDQGGGSTEVSYVFPNNLDAFGVHSIDQLGTIALRDLFLTMGEDGKRLEPSANQRRISAQNERVQAHIAKVIRDWEGYPQLVGKKIHVYAMGSAIVKMHRKSTPALIHNKVTTTKNIRTFVNDAGSKLDESTQQVRTLYKALQAAQGPVSQGEEVGYLDRQLVAVYGLPVYACLLDKFSVDHLRICGYGLRYGAYYWIYQYKLPISS